MNGDVLVLLAAAFGLTLKRLATPPRWQIAVGDVVEIITGAGTVLLLFQVVPAGWIPGSFTANELRESVFVSLLAFGLGPGVTSLGKALFYEKLPAGLRALLPPQNRAEPTPTKKEDQP